MEKLIESGLFGKGLLPVNRKTMVDRYNCCLDDIGLPKTNLTSFHIDGWGWSPEIADEQENKFYLSHWGPANPYAILLSPAQENRPVYFPYHTFDRDVMRIIFHTYRNQIADLTTQTALWIDVDQEITKYNAPQDLLMIDSINLKFSSTDRLMSAARNQRHLVRQFYDEENAWGDPALHEKLIESCKLHGDLRFRSLEVPDLPYTHVRSFYTRAFNGLYIFRDLPGGKPLLIFENDESVVSGEQQHGHIEYSLGDLGLLQKLFEEKLVTIDFKHHANNIDDLTRLQFFIYADTVAERYPEVDVSQLTGPKKKAFLAELSKKLYLRDIYFDLEALIRQLQKGERPNIADMSTELTAYLSLPNPELNEMTRLAVWKLLVNMFPTDVFNLYAYDKDAFFSRYQKWAKTKKAWVVKYLVQDYRPTFME